MPRIDARGVPTLRLALTCAAPAVIIGFAALLPFLGSAFNIDDVTFMLQAKHVLVDPLHPTAFDMVFDGARIRLSQHIVTGPVMAYLLVPSVMLSRAEYVAHATQIVLLALAAVATAALALRLELDRYQAAIASLFVVVSPAVLGMAATAMPDVAAMAFTVMGMERVVAWKQTRRPPAGLAAALLLALATLTRPHAVLIVVCAGLWLIPEDRWRCGPWRWPSALFDRVMTPLALALAFASFIVYVTRDPLSGGNVAGTAVARIESQSVTFNLASFALHWVVAFPLALVWPVLRGRRFVNFRRTCIAFSLGLFLTVQSGFLATDWVWALLIILFVGHALDVLTDIIVDAWRRRDQTQMVLGVWLLIAAAAATYVQLPSKFLIPSAPAMALLIARESRNPETRRLRARLLVTACVAALTLGGLIIRAETELAEIGREGGRVVAKQVQSGATVWMDGGWGYQWYAMAAGAIPLAETPPMPKPGDVVVAGLRARLLRSSFPNKTLLARRIYVASGGRIDGDGAGFFTNVDGPWPWLWSRREIGRIEVWRIDSVPGAQ